MTDSRPIKDPWCILSIAVIRQTANDAKRGDKKARAWFESDDYKLYLDFIGQCINEDLPHELRPEGVY